IVGSKALCFIVGPKKETIYAHSEVIASISKPLKVLINGDMSKAKSGIAKLPDLKTSSFLRFLEYMYTDNYRPSGPEVVPVEGDTKVNSHISQPRTSHAQHSESDMASPVPSVAHSALPETRFLRRRRWYRGMGGPPYAPDLPPFTARENTGPQEDYSSVFLCHAKVYVFADRYDMFHLKRLAGMKLRKMLLAFKFNENRLGDIETLVKYTYENTTPREAGGTEGPLRWVVLDYPQTCVEQLIGRAGFEEQLAAYPVLARVLLWRMARDLDKISQTHLFELAKRVQQRK
ncbi:hypothetical protein K470DRAFT_211776, partial [Piedraia hortae CBS 480.64]